MSFEEMLRVETRAMSREFAVYGGIVGFVLGVIAAVVVGGVFL
ncbi:hypothetical protein [Stenotrophomonas sp. 278]|nr:hypothetical protein [Stenotrophomonas sp. 278]